MQLFISGAARLCGAAVGVLASGIVEQYSGGSVRFGFVDE